MTAASRTPRGSQCLCRGCGKLFRSERPFARHFTGDYDLGTRRCLTTTELQAKGYVQDARGVWRFAPRPFGSTRAGEGAHYDDTAQGRHQKGDVSVTLASRFSNAAP